MITGIALVASSLLSARLETALAGHHHVHQDEVGLELLRLGEPVVGVFRRGDFEAVLRQQIAQELAVGGRVVDDQDVLDGHCLPF
jgi:hypothetical protein